MGAFKSLAIEGIPITRVLKSGAELHQVLADDMRTIRNAGTQWVKDVASAKHGEIIGAGNPKYHTVEIDGTTGADSRARRGFRPGSLEQAHNSVRFLYLGRQLADLANVLRPVLVQTILEAFPNSKTGTLSREWAWYVQRGAGEKGGGGKSTPSQRVGIRVPPDLGIYDVLWLAPEGKDPASYSWFANYFARHSTQTKFNYRTTKRFKLRVIKKLRSGYASEAARRMRSKRLPGVTVVAMFVAHQLTGPMARNRKYGVPVIRVAFDSSLKNGIN